MDLAEKRRSSMLNAEKELEEAAVAYSKSLRKSAKATDNAEKDLRASARHFVYCERAWMDGENESKDSEE